MAYTAETINSRIKNLRGDAVANARAMLTHMSRLEKARENLAIVMDDLDMFRGNRRAEITPAEAEFDKVLAELLNADEVDPHALAAHLETYHVSVAVDADTPEPAVPTVSVDEDEDPPGVDTAPTTAPRSRRSRSVSV